MTLRIQQTFSNLHGRQYMDDVLSLGGSMYASKAANERRICVWHHDTAAECATTLAQIPFALVSASYFYKMAANRKFLVVGEEKGSVSVYPIQANAQTSAVTRPSFSFTSIPEVLSLDKADLQVPVRATALSQDGNYLVSVYELNLVAIWHRGASE